MATQELQKSTHDDTTRNNLHNTWPYPSLYNLNPNLDPVCYPITHQDCIHAGYFDNELSNLTYKRRNDGRTQAQEG